MKKYFFILCFVFSLTSFSGFGHAWNITATYYVPGVVMPGIGYVSFSSYRHSPRLYFWGNYYSWYYTSPASFYYMDPDQPIRDSSMKNAMMAEGERRYQEWVMVQRARQAANYALEQAVTPEQPSPAQPLEAPSLEVAPQETPR